MEYPGGRLLAEDTINEFLVSFQETIVFFFFLKKSEFGACYGESHYHPVVLISGFIYLFSSVIKLKVLRDSSCSVRNLGYLINLLRHPIFLSQTGSLPA
jgi:hypothetical protein